MREERKNKDSDLVVEEMDDIVLEIERQEYMENRGLTYTDEGLEVNFENDASNGLSHQKMVAVRDTLHPRYHQEEAIKPFTSCGSSTGRHPFFCINGKNSDFDEFGIAISLYFKLAKWLAVLFFVLAIITLPPILIFSLNQKSDDAFLPVPPFVTKGFLSKTTLGNIGAGEDMCTSGKLGSGINDTLHLYCSWGTITSITGFGLPATSSSTCHKEDKSMNFHTSCNLENSGTKRLIEPYFEECIGEVECRIKVTDNMLTEECLNAYDGSLYLTAVCQSTDVEVFGTTINKKTVGTIIVATDLAAIFIFGITILLLEIYEARGAKHVLQNTKTIADFTLELSNLPTINMPPDKLKFRLRSHIQKVGNVHSLIQQVIKKEKEIRDSEIGIFDIQLGLNNTAKLEIELKIHQLHKEIEKYQNAQGVPPVKKIQKLERKIERQKLKLMHVHDKKVDKGKIFAIKAYITFNSFEGCFRLRKAYNIGCISRMIKKCYTPNSINYKYFAGNWLRIKKAPEPTDIHWENLQYGSFNRFVRGLFAVLITILILIISYLIIYYAKEREKDYSDDYPSINCNRKEFTLGDTISDYSKRVGISFGIIQCFCTSKLISEGWDALDIKFGEKKPCQEWWDTFKSSTEVLIGTAFFLAMISIFVRMILRMLTKVEKKHSLTKELTSSTIKIFIANFLNSAVIILLITMKVEALPAWLLLLQGEYKEFSVEWYRVIGSTIIAMMFFSIFTPHIPTMIKRVVMGIKRCNDRGCGRNEKKTKKLSQLDYEELYTGPEFAIEFRYSLVLCNLYLVMMYSAGIPILYFFFSLSIIFSYWMDKVFFITFYKRPPAYDLTLPNMVRRLFKYSVVLHFILAVLMYNNISVIQYDEEEGEEYPLTDQLNIFGNLNKPHIALLFVGMLIMLIAFLILKLMMKCCGKARHKFDQLKETEYIKNEYLIDCISMEDMLFDYMKLSKLLKKSRDDPTIKIEADYLAFLNEKRSLLKTNIINKYLDPVQIAATGKFDKAAKEFVKANIGIARHSELKGIHCYDLKVYKYI